MSIDGLIATMTIVGVNTDVFLFYLQEFSSLSYGLAQSF